MVGRQRGQLVGGGPAAARSVTSRKKPSKPAELMISIMRAGVLPAFHIAQLAAGLGDVAAYAEHGLPVAGAKADLALGDDRVLVLAGVQEVGAPGRRPRGMLDDRQRAAGVSGPTA